jgi:hypothetical protein
MKIVKVDIPIYFGRLDVVVSKNFNAALKKFKEQFDPKFNANQYDAFVFKIMSKKGYSRYVVFVKPNSSPKVIAHESVHIVNLIFDDTKIQIDIHNDEPQAYLTGWVTGEIYKALKR